MKKALLFGGLPVIAGIALIVVWAMANEKSSRGDDWTQILGTIESSRPIPGAVGIAYKYEYAGREYRNPNGKLTLKGGTGADRYAAGLPVLAYVNPKAPAESFLQMEPAPSPQGLIVGVILLAVGLALFIALAFFGVGTGRRPKRKKGRKLTRPGGPPTRPGTGTRPGRPSQPMSRLKPPPGVSRD